MDGRALLDLLATDPNGARVLDALADPDAEGKAARKRGPQVAGAVPGAAITGDALVDLAGGRVRARVDVVSDLAEDELAREVKRRTKVDATVRAFQGCAELKSHVAAPRYLYLRALPQPGRGAFQRPLIEPVLTMRAAQLSLDGEFRDPTGDLEAGRLQLTDDGALERRPEGLIVLARLAARPGLEVSGSTLTSAIAARRRGAPGRAPNAHIGVVLRDLLDSPEAADALAWLEDLAPDVPLYEGVRVDAAAVRAAPSEPGHRRNAAILTAISPDVPKKRRRAFASGAKITLT